MSVALFWFRQDLRCQDNPALTLACAQHKKLIPLYINEVNPKLKMGRAQQWWLHHSLNSLKESLKKVHLDLYLREAEPLTVLKELIKEYAIDCVYWNRCYEPSHKIRDEHIKAELKKLGVHVVSCNGSLLHEPWEVLNKSGEYFKVFTPYWHQCLKQMQIRNLHKITHWPAVQKITSDSLDEWNLLPKKPNWAIAFPKYWQPGEEGAWHALEQFIDEALTNYKDDRNCPSIRGTSHLSPHLHFGELSPQQIWSAVQEKMCRAPSHTASVDQFLSELGWREFSYQLLYHFPTLPTHSFKSAFNQFAWEKNAKALRAWQQGMTGYPIVDAGMRELWHTGYMHNRVRMIAASFLIKDLMIDWREGAAWFWDTLLDADLANNSASWQWVAGSGADAAPYYRIFNPVLQGEKFDPKGDYVKRWVPELRAMPNKWIHSPWKAPQEIVRATEYPEPIIDHAVAREIALSNYKRIK